ncbi:hypothetical protein [Evansella tamaricis]|uniref:Uncharacterized protein n=1 Tax=Evansella tamaricis TaxID=2069301 RepID=A0ABS6JK40_9BACI|nr:hypothetical protein [Evansella tamaricis]MBU9713182.1 hypothetical protein [Evansella tamaricis]
MEAKQIAETEELESLTKEIVLQIQAGDPRNLIVTRLMDKGLEEDPARDLVDAISERLTEIASEQQFAPSVLLPAVLGGLSAAIAGGIIWGLIVIFTEYELGIVAWGIGLLSGYGVALLSKGKKGVPLQVTAVVSSILGILIGKYIGYHYYLTSFFSEEFGAEFAAQFSIFSLGIIQSFFMDLTLMVNAFDLLWVVLAVFTAWKIPKAIRGGGI